jgi:hypothetical protein
MNRSPIIAQAIIQTAAFSVVSAVGGIVVTNAIPWLWVLPAFSAAVIPVYVLLGIMSRDTRRMPYEVCILVLSLEPYVVARDLGVESRAKYVGAFLVSAPFLWLGFVLYSRWVIRSASSTVSAD